MNPLNQTEEKREAVPNGVSRVGIAALGVLLQVLWIVWAALKLTRYYAWVQLAISVLAFLLALRIYGRHTNSATKLSWIIVILTFPIFGVCLYLLFGRSGAVNIMRGRFIRTDAELQPHYATPLDRAAMPQDPALQNQIHYLQTQAHYPACRNTDMTYYGDTNAALPAGVHRRPHHQRRGGYRRGVRDRLDQHLFLGREPLRPHDRRRPGRRVPHSISQRLGAGLRLGQRPPLHTGPLLYPGVRPGSGGAQRRAGGAAALRFCRLAR